MFLWRRALCHLLEAAISAVHLKWARTASLRVKRRAKADVVSGRGADERGVGEAWQHVESGGQYCGVCGDPQRPLNGHLLLDLVSCGDLIMEPLCHQVLRANSSTSDQCGNDQILNQVEILSLKSSHLLGLGVTQISSTDAVQTMTISIH